MMTTEEYISLGKSLGYVMKDNGHDIKMYWPDTRVLDYRGSMMDVIAYRKDDDEYLFWKWETGPRGIFHSTGVGVRINSNKAEKVLYDFVKDVKKQLKTYRLKQIEKL